MAEVLARRDETLSVDDVVALLNERVAGGVVDTTTDFRTLTLHVPTEHWVAVARACRDERALAFDMFDCLFGVDAREDGFDVVAVLYSTSTGLRLALRTRCDGGRETPVCPSLVDIYRGADWMERETWDMFGIEFPGHPALAPRLLTTENFEGWPLRKDFMLASRVAKPWPGVKEPVELDEDGNVIERVTGIGDAPGPYDLDKAMADQAKAANAASADGDDADGDGGGDADADADAPASGDDDEGQLAAGDDASAAASAKAKAEQRRKEQAQARRRKAADQGEEADEKDDA